MPWIKAKDLAAITGRLDELEKFKRSTQTDWGDTSLRSLSDLPPVRWGWDERIRKLEYAVAFLKKSEYGLEAAVGIGARRGDGPIVDILLDIKERQEKTDAAKYRELPDPCKNGHKKSGGKK